MLRGGMIGDAPPPAPEEIVHPGAPHAENADSSQPLEIPLDGRLDLQSACVAGILALLAFHALRVGAELFLPIAVAVLASFALQPIVRGLRRFRIPAPFGAAIVVAVLVGGVAAGISALSGPAADWLDRAPQTLRLIEQKIRFVREPMAQVAEATEEMAELTSLGTAEAEKVTVQGPGMLKILLARTQSALIALTAAFALLYFLLASGDPLVGRVVGGSRAAGWSHVQELLHRIELEVSRYLLTISLVNVGLAAAVACALWLLGMPNPVLWGVLAGVLNLVPYVGPLVTAVILTGVALISFEEPFRALLVPFAFLILNGLESMVVTPALLGRRLMLSPVAVLVAVMIGSWLWGAPGAIVAVPLLAVLKIVSDQVAPMHRLGLLLGGEASPAER